MMRSIRSRLMYCVLGTIILVWAVAVALSFHRATMEVHRWQDTKLHQFAEFLLLLDRDDLRMLSRTTIDGRYELVRQKLFGAYVDGDQLPREILFQVRDNTGTVVAASAALSATHDWEPALHSSHGMRTLTLAGRQWRALMVTQESGRTVSVFQSVNTQSDLTTGTSAKIALPLVIALPVLSILLWIAVGYSLLPLKRLSYILNTRPADTLEPISSDRTPTEVLPLVSAINQAMGRIYGTLERERAFTADAAHELKTPLAAIKVQAQVALGESDPALRELALRRIIEGVDRSAHLSDQLLMLARLDERQPVAWEEFELLDIAIMAVDEKSTIAARKGIGLSITGATDIRVVADRSLAFVLLANLVDNAIKYGRHGGRVEIGLTRIGNASTLVVQDDGPGISDADLPRLTDRFFRGNSGTVSGSGLGLSIVARIVRSFNATVGFGKGIDHQGLSVRVVFPDSSPHAALNMTMPLAG